MRPSHLLSAQKSIAGSTEPTESHQFLSSAIREPLANSATSYRARELLPRIWDASIDLPDCHLARASTLKQ
jgi:hypothetical protein